MSTSLSNADSLSRQIANFAVNTTAGSIPESASRIARLSLVDWLSVATAGCNEPVSEIVRDMIVEEAGAEQASVFGSDRQHPLRAAALANGATSHALDYDDTHFINIGHPSVAVFPAALAMTQHTESSLGQLRDAALIGMETACRIGDWLGRGHYQQGFHQTATAGCFGATMAAARLAGLSAAQAQHALGIAASRAAGLKSQFGTMAKPYHAGMAASSGIEAVLLAKRGFIANPDALNTVQGFADTHHAENKPDAVILDGIGEQYVFERVQHKFHACCHGTHAALEALNELRDASKPDPEQIESVTLWTHPRFLKVCNILSPASGLEAKFSLRFTAALALYGYDTGSIEIYTDEICSDPKLVALRDRVEVAVDDALTETQARVEIVGASGQSMTAEHDLEAPVSYEQRETKVRNKSASLLGKKRADDFWSEVSAGDNEPLGSLVKTVFGN